MNDVGIFRRGDLTLSDLMGKALGSPLISKAGAVVSFLGVLRGETHNNEPVEGLSLEAYESLVEEKLRIIAEEVKARYGVLEVLIYHAVGDLKVSD
ncbi:MAG: molybdenum cofactor biosynthesis protein MoaE, partial [Candidatus Bathyarchaeia archaeon]